VFGLTVGWGIVFFLARAWGLASLEATVAVVALASFVLARRNQLSEALLLSQVAFLFATIVFCLFFDVPSEAVPRVAHLFLLVLALLGYINYQRERSTPQLVLIVLCLGIFVVFASAPLSLHFARPVAEEVRRIGAWVNTTMLVGMLCGAVHVMQLQFARNFERTRDIEAALANREFELFYQPQVDEKGHLIGAESLIRWRQADGSYRPPAAFIPDAEQAGLMPHIGAYVLDEACKTLALWRQQPEMRGFVLAVNVSADQFIAEDFVGSVLARLHAFALDPACLKLELTESVMATDVDGVVEKMRVLRSAGIRISLDDFGTGYSSLGYLRRLPIQEIKIDRSFVQEAPENLRNRFLLKSIFDMARMLELSVVAEGIETKEQFALLQSFGCTTFQGFHFGRPVPLAEFPRHG
jgi:EAL domain-containing protein (putative c-di-GMP-specific phosphodiesterase class I)